MSPRISEPRAQARRGGSGFTLMEVIIAMVVCGVLMGVVVRFFSDSHRAYNIQESLAERDQNAQYVLKRLGERLMEAGANLPDSGFPVIIPAQGANAAFSLVLNPRGGIKSYYSDLPQSNVLPVDDATGFNAATDIVVVRADKTRPIEKYSIATGFTANGYVKGLKQGPLGQDSVMLAAPVDIGAGDVVYAYLKEDYALSGNSLSMGGMTLAEDIDSLGLAFYDANGSATTNWDSMHSAKVSVKARTQKRDPGYPGDGYRRSTVTSEVRLRNR